MVTNQKGDYENLDVGSVGRPRSGKTERLKALSYKYPCVFYFDANEDISGDRSFYKLPDKTPVVSSIKKFMYEYRVNKKKRIVYVPKDKASLDELSRWLHYAYKLGKIRYKHKMKAPTIIFIDEIWNYTNQHNIPIKLQELLREGRKYNILLYWTAQRMARMHTDIQTLSDKLYVFNLFAQDVKKLNEMTDVIDKPLLRSLDKYECILYDINDELFYRVDVDGNETELTFSKENSKIQESSNEHIENEEASNEDGDSKKAKNK